MVFGAILSTFVTDTLYWTLVEVAYCLFYIKYCAGKCKHIIN